MVNTWNSDCITPLEETDSTKVLDAQQQLQKTLSAGSNIIIENGEISASGTLTNVQADWTQNDSAEPDYIKNKPQNLVQDATYVHTDNNFSDSDKEKLNGIAAGAEVNVQSDWNVSDSDSDAFIKNKPTIPIVDQIYNGNSTNAQAGVAVSSAISTAVGGIRQVPSTQSTDNGKVLGVTDDQGTVGWVQQTAAQVQSDWNQSDSAAVDYIKNKPTIPAAVVVDSHYGASSSNAQAGTAVAEAIATVRQVPSTQSSDNGKVLGVTDNQGSLGWVNQPVIGTVNV